MRSVTPGNCQRCSQWIALLAVSVLVIAGVAPTIPVGATGTNSTITASPNGPNATATHRVTAVVQSESTGDSLNKFRVDYTASANPADVSNVGQSDVVAIGLDTDGDGAIDTDVSNDLGEVSVSNNGQTLSFGFGGNYNLNKGDRFIVEFSGVINPNAEGTFDVNQTLNYQSNPVHTHTTGLTIDGSDGTASISASPDTDRSTATHSVDRTVGFANDGTSLTTLEVNYSSASEPADVSKVTMADVSSASLDTDGDGQSDVDLLSKLTGVTTSDGGATVTLEFDGSVTLSENDRISVAFGNVTNPTASGDYPVEVRLDPSRSSPPTATLSITAASTATATPSTSGMADASITASPTDPNATATHNATGTVGSNLDGDSLNGFTVDYTASSNPTDVANVGQTDVVAVGIDTDGDGVIDVDVSDDLSEVSVSNNGHTLSFGFGGSYSLSKGDRVIVEYGNARNPDAVGTFDVGVRLNPQSTGESYTTGLTIEAPADTDETPADTDESTKTEPGANLDPQPPTAHSSTTHHIAARVGEVDGGSTLKELSVDYAVSQGDVGLGAVGLSGITVGVDTDADGVVDTSVTDRLTGVWVSTESSVQLSFDGSYTVTAGDTIIVTIEDVSNPDAGDHDVTVEINPSTTDSAVTTTYTTKPQETTVGSGVEDAMLVADPPAAGTNATHTAHVTLATSLTLDSVTVGYPDAVALEDVDASALVRFGVDADGDGMVDRSLQSAVGSVTTADGAVTIHLTESSSLAVGETLVVAFDGVQNPAIGDHHATVRLNDRPTAPVSLLIGTRAPRTATYQTGNGSRTVVQYPDDGTAVVDLNDVTDNGVSLVRVRIQLANGTEQLVVGKGEETYAPVDARGQELAQLPVDHNHVAVETATVVFDVTRSRLNRTTYGPGNVSLYYRENGSWTRAQTEFVGETGDSYQFAASGVSLSTYAVRVEPPNPREQPAIGVRNLSVSETPIEPGDSTAISVSLINDGEVAGSRTVSLSVNGVALANVTVSLAPGETATETFEPAFSRAGSYGIAVGNESVSVRVRGSNATATATTPTTRTSAPGFGAPAALLALALLSGLLVVRWRR